MIIKPFSDDLDWKSIDHALMYRLLSLPSEADIANRMIGAASEHAFPRHSISRI